MRRTVRWQFALVAISSALAVVLLGSPEYLAQPTYYETPVTLAVPDCGNESSPLWNVPVHDADFRL